MLRFLGDTKEEFLSDKLPSKLRNIVCDIEHYILTNEISDTLIITSVFRTHEEQKDICKRLGKKYYASVHEFWRGVDVVIKDADHAAHKRVQSVFNNIYPYGRSRYKSIVLHGSQKAGLGWHLHIQVNNQSV